LLLLKQKRKLAKNKKNNKNIKELFNRIINITSDEWSRVNLSWALQFLYKVAHLTAWISLIALFVTKFGIFYLPFFFLIYAVARITGAYVYANILHKISKDKLILYTALIGAILFIFALFLKPFNDFLFIFISIPVLAIFLSQLYILNSAFIEDLFTPLESERTFPIIESAETVGGIVGALLMTLLIANIPVANLINISVVCLSLTVPLILFHRKILKKLPIITVKKNIQNREAQETNKNKLKKLFDNFKILPFLKILFIVMILQWLFMHLLEFQFTKAVYKNISSGIHNPAEELTHGLSTLHIYFFTFALLMQILVASRIISTLGITTSLLLHPIVTLFSLSAMFFRFGYPAAVLTKLNFEMTSIIQKSAYHTSYYAINPKIREDAREVIEGFSQPIGTIIGMSLLITLQYLINPNSLNSVITGLMIAIAFIMLLILLKNENKYSQLSIKNLLHSKNSTLQLNAIEVLGQKGHKNSTQILTKTLRGNNLDRKVKIKILDTLGHIKEHESVLEILDYIDDDDRSVRIAALKALYKFDVIRKKSSKRPFSLHRIDTILKKQFEKEDDAYIKSLIIKILAKLNSQQIVKFILELLNSEDLNIKSNCIAACEYFEDINLIHYLSPFLDSKNPVIKGNTIIALWKYPKTKIRVHQELKQMLFSKNRDERIMAFYVIGEIEAVQEKNRLKDYLYSDDEEESLTAALALCKMNSKSGIDIVSKALLNAGSRDREKIFHEIELLSDKIKRNIKKYIHIHTSYYINDILRNANTPNLDELDRNELIKLRNAYDLVNDHEEVQNIDEILGNKELQFNPIYNG
jgi:HEAT repeat protein